MSSLRFILLCSLLVSAPLKAAVNVSVGIEPMRYLVEQLGGDRVSLTTLLKSGDAHALDPTPAQLLSLKKSDLYFAVGLPFERSLGKRLGDADRLVWLSDLYESSSHNGHDHSHLGLDPHRWTSPAEMLRMGEQVTETLTRLDPESAEYFQRQQQLFFDRVQILQTHIQSLLTEEVTTLVADHPAWGWFSEEFALHQLAVEQEGKLPSIRQMSALKKEVEASGAQYVVSAHGGAQAQALASLLELKLLVIDPLSYDWESALSMLAQGLAKP